MSLTKQEMLAGWGNAPVAECISYRPEKQRDLHHVLSRHIAPLIARGMGRSYGDAALQPQGVIRTERLNHLIAFDTEHGFIQAQAGATLAEIMEITLPKGWIIPVVPGTRFVTLGGAVASNVHGKNQFKEGDFAEHVHSLRLTLASGETLDCSPENNSEFFWATAGGMGMTGIIEDVTLKLKSIASLSLKTHTYRVDSLEDMLAAFEQYRADADYLIGWIDHIASGEKLGRGVFEAAHHITEEQGGEALSEFNPPQIRFSVPFFLPPFALNRYSMALYNLARFWKYSDECKQKTVGFDGFFHPLDSIQNWNRLYGRRGFFQYQCIIPETADTASHLKELLELLHSKQLFSFLAVLKYHREGKSLLSFSQKGYSLALDFPNTAHVHTHLPEITQWVIGHGGKIYLAKDAMLTPEEFNAMYKDSANRWRDVLTQCDPAKRFQSLMSERLQWKPAT